MINTVRMQKLSPTGVPLISLHFVEQEAYQVDVNEAQDSVTRRNQNGKPTRFLRGEKWTVINVYMRVHNSQTMDKLRTIRNSAISGSLWRVYPALVSLPDLFYDCLAPVDGQGLLLGAGQYRVGDVLSIVFEEASKDGQLIVSEEILTG